MAKGLAADTSRVWQTEKMKLLDSPETRNATIRLLAGGVPGTGKPFEAEKVSNELLEMMLAEMRDSSGVHVETALATLGALAGFSGQMAIREEFIKSGKLGENSAFVVVTTKNGEKYYFGDLLIEVLFENKPGNVSIYSMVAAAARHSGAKELPDTTDMARYVAGTVGDNRFGVPRIPAQHMPRRPTIALLDQYWNPVRNLLVLNVSSPAQWPFVIGLAAQKLIVIGKGVLDPALAAKLVMETAIPMARIDPARIHLAYLQ